MVEFSVGKLIVRVVKGDITELSADIIVNAANRWLKHGGGVALAIVNRGGKIIQDESDEYVARNGPIPTGGVAVTGAGRIKAKFVIHAVGPVYGEPSHEAKLASAFRNTLIKAEGLGARTIVLPAISMGVYGYPADQCAKILAQVILEFAETGKVLKEITVCLYDDETYETFKNVFYSALKSSGGTTHKVL